MIPKSKIEKFIEKETFQVPYDGTNDFYNRDKIKGIELGVSFAEKELENLAIEFANYLFLYRQNSLGEWKHQNRNKIIKTTKELFEIFKQEKYEQL